MPSKDDETLQGLTQYLALLRRQEQSTTQLINEMEAQLAQGQVGEVTNADDVRRQIRELVELLPQEQQPDKSSAACRTIRRETKY